jgi:hypothetical protein
MTPPISSVRSAATPRSVITWGRIDVRKKTWVEPPSTSSETIAVSRQRRPEVTAAAAGAGAEAGTPQCTSAPHPSSTTPPSTKDSAKPRRAAAIAPHSGPITPPHGHRRLHRRHLAPDLAGILGSPGADEREGRRRAHHAEDEPAHEEPRQGGRCRHGEEPRALQELDEHEVCLGVAPAGQPAPQGRHGHGRQRRDPQDPARPAQRGGAIPGREALDVERQAHVDEGPREGADEHRERQDVRAADDPERSHRVDGTAGRRRKARGRAARLRARRRDCRRAAWRRTPTGRRRRSALPARSRSRGAPPRRGSR